MAATKLSATDGVDGRRSDPDISRGGGVAFDGYPGGRHILAQGVGAELDLGVQVDRRGAGGERREMRECEQQTRHHDLPGWRDSGTR